MKFKLNRRLIVQVIIWWRTRLTMRKSNCLRCFIWSDWLSPWQIDFPKIAIWHQDAPLLRSQYFTHVSERDFESLPKQICGEGVEQLATSILAWIRIWDTYIDYLIQRNIGVEDLNEVNVVWKASLNQCLWEHWWSWMHHPETQNRNLFSISTSMALNWLCHFSLIVLTGKWISNMSTSDEP